MKFYKRRAVMAELSDYCHLAKPDEIVEVCEWSNGEGWDVIIGTRTIQLTHGELQAINVLANVSYPREIRND